MNRLSIETPLHAQTVVQDLYRDVSRRLTASPPGLCPVDMALNFLRLCHAQTCGKCVPCRIGLSQLEKLLQDVLDQRAGLEVIDLIERTARVIADSADCAIGYEAAAMVLHGLHGFREDYEEHIGDDALGHFGEYEDDSVFVRNDEEQTDYEILLDGRNYHDVYGDTDD